MKILFIPTQGQNSCWRVDFWPLGGAVPMGAGLTFKIIPNLALLILAPNPPHSLCGPCSSTGGRGGSMLAEVLTSGGEVGGCVCGGALCPFSNLCLRCSLSCAFSSNQVRPTSYHKTGLPLWPLLTMWPLTLCFRIHTYISMSELRLNSVLCSTGHSCTTATEGETERWGESDLLPVWAGSLIFDSLRCHPFVYLCCFSFLSFLHFPSSSRTFLRSSFELRWGNKHDDDAALPTRRHLMW